MNEQHQMCGSDEWRQVVRDLILPWALADADLGDDVLEVGPGYGATTESSASRSPALQDRLFAEVARVLRPGGVLVAGDSLASDDLKALHEGDTYVPVDPGSLPDRLRAMGFVDVDVKVNEFGWAAVAKT